MPLPNTAATSVNNDFRLPRYARPINYRIEWVPDIPNKKFMGQVWIDIEVDEATNQLVLNAKELMIIEAHAQSDQSSKINAAVTLDEEREFAILDFNETLGAGPWQLYLCFEGIHNDKLKGFYRSRWKDDQGKTHDLVATQFESTDARQAFPCFDEPDFKATYEISVAVPKNMVAISNGRVLTDIGSGAAITPASGKVSFGQMADLKTVRFRKTMPMSTYLVAVIVGEFQPSETVLVNGLELAAWAVTGKRHLTSFALRAGAFAINYFEKYFRVKYPDANKCDLIAIPDFASGAMENKDCITFRENALLLDEATATHAEKERVAEVVMHELAHMWFGDLVTMRWWNGLWLNEAFATFMATKCMDAFNKDWRVWDGFGIGRAAAARVDALNTTHPIECPVNKPEEAQELFDVISYQKGCSVLYQIEQFIGEEVFRNGITHYLNKHAFGNTETYDLWDSLELACRKAKSDIPVRSIMDKWIFVAGHPMLTVCQDQEDGFVRIKQQQFKFLPEGRKAEQYPVPVRMKIRGGAKNGDDSASKSASELTEQSFVLDEPERKIFVGKDFKWVIVNTGGSGFYRVTYDDKLSRKLISDVSKVQENLSVIERFNLVNDSWAAVRAGVLSASSYLETIKLFEQEDDINVWSIILNSLQALRLLVNNDARPGFQNFVRTLCSPMAKKLGWKPAHDEAPQTRQLRSSLQATLGTIGGDMEAQKSALQYFDAWQKDKASIDSNLAPALVTILAYNGDKARYDQFKKLAKEAKTPQEYLRFLYALAAFRHLDLLTQTLNSCLDGSVKTQDAPYFFGSVAANEIATETAWNFLKDNWDKMIQAYPENGVVRMCSMVIPALDRPELEKEAKQFFGKHKVSAGDMAISQALEQLRINVLLRERESDKLTKFASSITWQPLIDLKAAGP